MNADKEARLISSILTKSKKIGDIRDEQITHKVARYMIEVDASDATFQRIPAYFKDQAFYVSYLKNSKPGEGVERLLTVPAADRSAEVLMAAVCANGESLQYIAAEHVTHDLTMAAVSENGAALAFVPAQNRSVEVCRAALGSYFGYYAWDSIPVEVKAHEKIQETAVDAAHRVSSLGEHVDDLLITTSKTDLKIRAIQLDYNMLVRFPDLEQFELMRAYIRRNDFPYNWFGQEDLPDAPAEVLKRAGNERDPALQVAILHWIEDCSLEKLGPLAKASRSPKQKDLLCRLFGSREVLMHLDAKDKARGRWFAEDLGL